MYSDVHRVSDEAGTKGNLHQWDYQVLKAIAKQNSDYKEGRPKVYGKKQIEHAIKLLESYSYKQVEESTGISKSTLIRAKRQEFSTAKKLHNNMQNETAL